MRKLQITIPEPCHENWSQMTPAEKGRFCAACQKNVYDFTKSTDREIINTYNKDKKLCGRFLNTQLNRALIIPKERKSFWLASVFFGMISLFNTKIAAQEKPKTEQTDARSNALAVKNNTNSSELKTITGVVSDSSGPLPGANIVVQGTSRGVQADMDGSYKIVAKEGEKLVYSFLGMKDVVKTVGQSNVMNTTMKESDHVSSGLILTVDYNEPRKRPYVERAYRVVETWFEY